MTTVSDKFLNKLKGKYLKQEEKILQKIKGKINIIVDQKEMICIIK